ncbi:DUF1569 domain-containing protein [Mucilaginibacter sp. AW1-3]
MKTIFDQPTRDELIARICTLNNNSTAQWGKMNVYQMVKHCSLWEQMILNNAPYPRVFAGRIFGRIALNAVLKNDAPLRRNTPTLPEFKTTGQDDVAPSKAEWIALIQTYPEKAPAEFMHPFFGKMTRDQVGQMAYKHIDHHLRQFNS